MKQATTYETKGNLFIFTDQHEVFLHLPEDSFAYLLESSMKVDLVLFTSTGFGFELEFELPLSYFFYLLKESVSKIQVTGHLISWLHWHCCIT